MVLETARSRAIALGQDFSSLGLRCAISEEADIAIDTNGHEYEFEAKEKDRASESSDISRDEDKFEKSDSTQYSVRLSVSLRENRLFSSAQTLDAIVEVAGNRWFFGGVLGVLAGWVVTGIVLKAPDLWQIAFQDISSIQVRIITHIYARKSMGFTYFFVVLECSATSLIASSCVSNSRTMEITCA